MPVSLPESDKTYTIDQLSKSVDLEVDVSPFITSFLEKNQAVGDISVGRQAESFIGSCTPAADWKETNEPPKELRVGLSAGSNTNPFFVDFQYHCSSVFSMLDTFSYKEGDQIKPGVGRDQLLCHWLEFKPQGRHFESVESSPAS